MKTVHPEIARYYKKCGSAGQFLYSLICLRGNFPNRENFRIEVAIRTRMKWIKRILFRSVSIRIICVIRVPCKGRYADSLYFLFPYSLINSATRAVQPVW
jgi:hypothetical protein